MRMVHKEIRCGLMLIALVALVPNVVFAQKQATDAETTYQPVTTVDVKIPVDQLRVLVKPLTKSELKVEADAWFELLRQKARQIAAAQLGVKKTNVALDSDSDEQAKAAVDEAQAMEAKAAQNSAAAEAELTATAKEQLGVDQVKTAVEKSADANEKTVSSETAPQTSDSGDMTEVASAKKDELLTTVNKLQEERTALADRLKVVLDSLEAKGGDAADYRKYIRRGFRN